MTDIEEAIEQIRKILADFEGYVDQEQPQSILSTEVNFTVRLPKENLDEASEEIKLISKKIGDEWAIGQDITEQYVDLEVQLCELEKEEAALREKIARDPEDHLSEQLVNLESEIELTRGKIDYRDERLAFATLTLQLFNE